MDNTKQNIWNINDIKIENEFTSMSENTFKQIMKSMFFQKHFDNCNIDLKKVALELLNKSNINKSEHERILSEVLNEIL